MKNNRVSFTVVKLYTQQEGSAIETAFEWNIIEIN